MKNASHLTVTLTRTATIARSCVTRNAWNANLALVCRASRIGRLKVTSVLLFAETRLYKNHSSSVMTEMTFNLMDVSTVNSTAMSIVNNVKAKCA